MAEHSGSFLFRHKSLCSWLLLGLMACIFVGANFYIIIRNTSGPPREEAEAALRDAIAVIKGNKVPGIMMELPDFVEGWEFSDTWQITRSDETFGWWEFNVTLESGRVIFFTLIKHDDGNWETQVNGYELPTQD